jgi:hypothetical protein
MSLFISNLKAALENIVMVREGNPAKEAYAYAEKMETMMKTQLKEELTIISESDNIKEKLEEFINKL